MKNTHEDEEIDLNLLETVERLMESDPWIIESWQKKLNGSRQHLCDLEEIQLDIAYYGKLLHYVSLAKRHKQ